MSIVKTIDPDASYATALLRGGRLIKWKGQAASLSPSLGQLIASVSVFALGRALTVGARKSATAAVLGGVGVILTTSGVSASCVESPGHVHTCSNEIDETVNLTNDTDDQLTITSSATITGETDGINAQNNGSGALSITTTGTTTGTDKDGIAAWNYGTDLTIDAATTSGGAFGIYAANYGSGALSITTTGTTTGTGDEGIEAWNYGTSLTIDAATTSGGVDGIDARNYGSGALSITTTGTTTGTGDEGIDARNYGTSLTIDAADTTGGDNGIWAKNKGTRALSITTTGTTTGSGYEGIEAWNYGTSLTIDAADTTGGDNGIWAKNKGTGALSITATGTTTGSGHEGIEAWNYGTSLTIDAADTTGGDNGIWAKNKGTDGTDLTIDAATTSGGDDGIYAVNYGTRALSITTTGTTTGTGDQGIEAWNKGTDGTDLTIDAATTSGGDDGIYAVNYGTRALSITTTGTTTGTSDQGIEAWNYGTSLTIDAATTSGGVDGIDARNYGSGALSITTTGTTTGSGDVGIEAKNTSGTGITIDANNTYGKFGFYVHNMVPGTSGLSIITRGTTTGTDGAGIYARNYGSGALDITTRGTTTGTSTSPTAQYVGGAGIDAVNEGSGALNITTEGKTTGGADHDGIYAVNSSYGNNLTIDAATTSGGVDGIDASNSGSGALSITTSGAITGGTGYGIKAKTTAGKTVNITLNSGSAVSSAAGLGIFNNDGNSTTTVNAGASVAGKIVLGDGVDSLNFAGGDFSGVTMFDGGAGTSDVLKFSGSSGSVNSTLNWEIVEINDGSSIAFSNNALMADMLSINAGGTLNAVTGTFAMTGNLSNAGTINMADAATGDKVTVSGNFTGGGQIKLDVDTKADTSDQLAIAGNTSGTTTLSFTNLTPGKETGKTINNVMTVAGTSSATDFSGSMVGGIYTYTLTYDAGDFDLVGALNSTGSVYKVAPTVLGGFNQMSSLHQRKSYRQVESRNDKTSSNPHVALTMQRQPNVWLDTGGTRTREKIQSGISFKNTNQDLTLGVDFDVGGSSGNWVVGGYILSGTQEASITDATGTGSITSKGRGVGATATWYGNAGTYVDAQGQITRLESDMSSSAGGVLAESVSSKAYALSVEVGHRLALSEKAGLIPQVQLSWGRLDGAEFTDTGNTAVDMRSNDTQTGRVGLAYEYVNNNQSTFYAIGSIVHDFKRANKVKAGITSLSEDINETLVEIGIGGSIVLDEASLFGPMNRTSKVYGSVFYRQSFDNSDIKVFAVNAGIQIDW